MSLHNGGPNGYAGNGTWETVGSSLQVPKASMKEKQVVFSLQKNVLSIKNPSLSSFIYI